MIGNGTGGNTDPNSFVEVPPSSHDQQATRLAKHSLRKQLRKQRRSQSSWAAVANALGLARQIKRVSRHHHRHIGFYWPAPGELDCRPAMCWLHQQRREIFLPVVAADQQSLLFHQWLPRNSLRHNRLALEPNEHTCRRPASALDVLYIPLLGFDKTGARLGQGGGFYDRTLAELPRSTSVVGLAYDCQEVEKIPTEPHDQRLDLILTESRTLYCRTP